jgi:hypothetical protein
MSRKALNQSPAKAARTIADTVLEHLEDKQC